MSSSSVFPRISLFRLPSFIFDVASFSLFFLRHDEEMQENAEFQKEW